jgi:hypothetical protein
MYNNEQSHEAAQVQEWKDHSKDTFTNADVSECFDMIQGQ